VTDKEPLVDILGQEAMESLVQVITDKVWLRLSGNGSLRISIDTDVDCYTAPEDRDEKTLDAYDWVQYFVLSTINRLHEEGRLASGSGADRDAEP